MTRDETPQIQWIGQRQKSPHDPRQMKGTIQTKPFATKKLDKKAEVSVFPFCVSSYLFVASLSYGLIVS